MRGDADFFEYGNDDAFLVFDQCGQKMDGQKLGIAVLRGEIVSALDGFLSLDGEFIPTDRHGALRIVMCN